MAIQDECSVDVASFPRPHADPAGAATSDHFKYESSPLEPDAGEEHARLLPTAGPTVVVDLGHPSPVTNGSGTAPLKPAAHGPAGAGTDDWQPVPVPVVLRLKQAAATVLGAGCNLQQRFWESGTATMLTAALVSSLGALTVALIDNRVPVFEIVLIRSGLSFALSAAAAAAQKLPNLMGTRALWPLLGVRGFVGAASMTLYYEAINRLPLADVMVLMYSNPVLCALLAWLIRGERLGLVGCSGIAVTIAGVVLVSEPPFLFGGAQWSHTRSVGVILAILAAIFTAFAFFAIGSIPKSESALVIALWFHGAAAISAVFPLMVGYPDRAVLPGLADTELLLALAICSFIGQMLLNRSFQITSAAKGSSLMCTQVLHAHVFGIFLLDEHETLWGTLGSVAIAAGVVTVNAAKSGAGSAGKPCAVGLPAADHIETKTPTAAAAAGLPVLLHEPNEAHDGIEAFGHERQPGPVHTPFSAVPIKESFWGRRSGSLRRGLELQGMTSISLASQPDREEGGLVHAAKPGEAQESSAAQQQQDEAGPLLMPRRHGQKAQPASLRERELSWTGDWLFAAGRQGDVRAAVQQYSQVAAADDTPR